MKLSARTRYAARILLDLARYMNAGPVAATLLSKHTGVSVQFIEQILKPLKQAGFTCSTRGASGGHSLAQKPEDITLGAVVRLMEGGVHLTLCSSTETEVCSSMDYCPAHLAWKRVSLALERELDSITIKDLLDDYYSGTSQDDPEFFPVCDLRTDTGAKAKKSNKSKKIARKKL